MAKQNVNVYIKNPDLFYIGSTQIGKEELEQKLAEELQKELSIDATAVLRADQDVSIQNIVVVIDAMNNINAANNTQYKLILATKPIE